MYDTHTRYQILIMCETMVVPNLPDIAIIERMKDLLFVQILKLMFAPCGLVID